MVEEEKVDLLAERLVNRIQKANEYILKRMGENVNKIKKLTPTEARRLINILKYGGTYEEIVNKLSEYTGLDIKDIDEIFKEYAKEDQAFYKQFYQYKDIPFVPYENNYILKNQTQALANIAKNEMYNFTRDNILGYTIRDLNGNVTFKGIRETYNELLDNALINVSQGTDTFDSAMTHILKEIGSSGIKTLQYQNGRAIRLDSAVRMHLKSRINELHNENQKLFGNEFGFDGWEISVHGNPAPDHQDVQGRQFTIDEYNKLQEEGKAKDYKGKSVDIRSFSKKGNMSYRPISEMNCYHKAFPIILGVSEPEYTDEELKEIKDQANEKFEFEGKEYSMYEATQLQRALERKVREQKDIHILAKESNNKPLMQEAQTKINLYRTKYGQLSQASGLPTKMERMKVSGYRKIAVKQVKENKNYVSAEQLLNDYYKKDLGYDNDLLNIMKQSSPSYQKDLQGLNDILGDKDAKDIVKIRGYNVRLNLHKDDVDIEESFKRYINNSNHVNGLLSGKDVMPMPEIIEDIENTSSALKKAPKYEGTVWRYDDRQELPKVGETIKIDSFYSTSKNKEQLDMVPYYTTRKTLYEIKSKTGRDINTRSKYTNENEILFDLNSEFKVVKAETKDGKNYVTMEQIIKKQK